MEGLRVEGWGLRVAGRKWGLGCGFEGTGRRDAVDGSDLSYLILTRDTLLARSREAYRCHALLVYACILVPIDHKPFLPRELDRRRDSDLSTSLRARAIAAHMLCLVWIARDIAPRGGLVVFKPEVLLVELYPLCPFARKRHRALEAHIDSMRHRGLTVRVSGFGFGGWS